MHVFESLDKQEVIDFFNKTKPDFWKAETRVDVETLNTIYVLRWVKIKKISQNAHHSTNEVNQQRGVSMDNYEAFALGVAFGAILMLIIFTHI